MIMQHPKILDLLKQDENAIAMYHLTISLNWKSLSSLKFILNILQKMLIVYGKEYEIKIT